MRIADDTLDLRKWPRINSKTTHYELSFPSRKAKRTKGLSQWKGISQDYRLPSRRIAGDTNLGMTLDQRFIGGSADPGLLDVGVGAEEALNEMDELMLILLHLQCRRAPEGSLFLVPQPKQTKSALGFGHGHVLCIIFRMLLFSWCGRGINW